MAVSIEQFRSRIALNLRGMMRQNIDQCIQWAARDFTRQTGGLKEVTQAYYIDSLKQATVDGDVFAVIKVETVDGEIDANDYVLAGSTLSFEESLGEDQLLTIRVLKQVEHDAQSFPDVLFEDYLDAIVDGSLYRGHSMGGGAWYSPELANFHRARYQQAISETKRELFNQNVRGINYQMEV